MQELFYLNLLDMQIIVQLTRICHKDLMAPLLKRTKCNLSKIVLLLPYQSSMAVIKSEKNSTSYLFTYVS